MAPRAQALLVRNLNQEMVASDFCPELNCTGCRNKATVLGLFPVMTPCAMPFLNRGALLPGTPLCLHHWVMELTAIQTTNKQRLRWSDLINTCVFPLDITNKTALELANIRTLPLFWAVQGFLGIWMSEQQEKTHSRIYSCWF